MPSLITLEEAKDHCRVSHTLEDDKIWGYCNAAYNYIANYLDGSEYMTGDSPAFYPQDLKLAAMIIVGAYYDQKEVPPQAIDLIFPYRVNMGI